jgi:hypothetical protein
MIRAGYARNIDKIITAIEKPHVYVGHIAW